MLTRATHSAAFVGRLHCLGCRAQVGDQPLAHAGRFHYAVAAITQRTLVKIGGKHARAGAAYIENDDQVFLRLVHRVILTGPAPRQKHGLWQRVWASCG